MASAPTSSTVVRMEREITPDLMDQHRQLRASELLKLMDSCACLSAEKHSRSTSVTLSMDDVNFAQVSPKLGQILVFQSQVNRAFKTSMEVGLRVDVEDLIKGTCKRLCGSYFVFVALDSDKKKVAVPPLHPETEEDTMRYDMALERREIRFARNSIVNKVQSNSSNQQHLRYSLSLFRKDGSTKTKSSKRHASKKDLPGVLSHDQSVARPIDSRATDNLPRSELVLPPHANHMGSTFGGQVMAWCHDRAVVSAMRHCKGAVTTASVDDVYFLESSAVGDRIDVQSRVNRIFNHSLEVGVRVEAVRKPDQRKLITRAYFTFVVMNPDRGVPALEIQTEDDRRRYQRALGRRRIRLERLALRRNGRSVAWPFNADDVKTLTHYNIRSLLKAAANGHQTWGLLAEEEGVKVWSKTHMHSGVSIKTRVEVELEAHKVFYAVRSPEHRLAWDPMVSLLEVRQELEPGSDVAWIVANNSDAPIFAGPSESQIARKVRAKSGAGRGTQLGPEGEVGERQVSPLEKDFALLRTWRTNKERSSYVLASHSIDHPAVPKMAKYPRGEVASSGFIVRRLGPKTCEVTYVVQLGTAAVNLVIDELVGGAKLSIGRMRALQRYCAQEEHFNLPPPGQSKQRLMLRKRGNTSKAKQSSALTSGGGGKQQLGEAAGDAEETRGSLSSSVSKSSRVSFKSVFKS